MGIYGTDYTHKAEVYMPDLTGSQRDRVTFLVNQFRRDHPSVLLNVYEGYPEFRSTGVISDDEADKFYDIIDEDHL